MVKLFRVTVTMTYVLAEEKERDAEFSAEAYAKDHLNDAGDPFNELEVEEITSLRDVPGGWLNSIPYGDAAEGDKLVKDYLQPSA